jgi:hypothetical protein
MKEYFCFNCGHHWEAEKEPEYGEMCQSSHIEEYECENIHEST